MTYTVNAYTVVNGKKALMAWATGLNHKAAKALFELYYDEGHGLVRMEANQGVI